MARWMAALSCLTVRRGGAWIKALAPELQIYLVAVSHASHRAPKDVTDCILATNPAVIALEIDQVRGLGTSGT